MLMPNPTMLELILARLGMLDKAPAELAAEVDEIREDRAHGSGGADPEWVDLRTTPRVRTEHLRGRPVGSRAWTEITGITFHQTGNAHLHAAHRLLPAVPAHALIDRRPTTVLLQPATAYMQHAHALNATTIGIETVCHAAGIEGDARTLWIPKGKRADEVLAEPTDAQLEATYELGGWYCDLVAAHGGQITEVWAHRQGRDDRSSDPGSRLWQGAVLPLARDRNLDASPRRKVGTGTFIPDRWSRESNGIVYRRGIP